MPVRRTALALVPLLLLVCTALSSPLAAGPGCTPSATELCLLGSRFRVELTWQSALPQGGEATAVALSDDLGYFTFLEPAYVELYVKVLDGTAINGHYWVFYSTLTDVEYTLTVTDTATSAVKSYFNPLGTRANVTDTAAFPAGTGILEPAFALPDPPSEPLSGSCTPDATTHCLAGGRFETVVTWATPAPATGPGVAVPLTSHSGGFYYFSPSNLDLLVKVVEACDFFEVHFGAMSGVEISLTLTDTVTAATKVYFSPTGSSAAVGDLTAFARPELPCAVFADGFESGDTSAWSLVVGGS